MKLALARSAISWMVKNDVIALWAACVLLRRMSLCEIETQVFMIWTGLDVRMMSFMTALSSMQKK